MTDDVNENNAVGNHKINNAKTKLSRSFEHKTKITGSTSDDKKILNTKVDGPLTYE